ncbi:hypothetical protein [Arthrobacter methylotrophus]|uniref:Uncharacterized protein n=1 Tax=Arthrobacter methylotrophus TaxID=121291 RepID=A0ABV5UTS9_9MICC
MRQGLRRTAQAAFWILATCLLYFALAIPSTLAKLIFGSPA